MTFFAAFSVSAKLLVGGMRMRKIQSQELAEGTKARKVHPQSSCLGGCGCANPEIQSSQGRKARKKCIRKGTAWRNADAQKPKSRPGRRKQIKKSASAKVLPGGMRMPKSGETIKPRKQGKKKEHPHSQESWDADAQNPRSRHDRRKQIKKSASASLLKKNCGCTINSIRAAKPNLAANDIIPLFRLVPAV